MVDLYLDDWGRWRTVDPSGVIRPFAGTGSAGFSGDGGPAVSATFGGRDLGGLTADQEGNVYFGDHLNHRMRKVDTKGTISTFVGTGQAGSSGDGGLATKATIDGASSITADVNGDIIFADYDQHVVRKIDADGLITTIAGTGVGSYSGDCGPATNAGLGEPGVVDVQNGIVYISDGNRIRIIVP